MRKRSGRGTRRLTITCACSGLGAGPEAYEVLIVGGEDHKTGQADKMEERWDRLEGWTRERFSMAQAVEYRWSGQVMEPVDGMAFIGRNPGDEPNVYIATGDSGHGMTHGTIAGMLLTRPDRRPGKQVGRALRPFPRETAGGG